MIEAYSFGCIQVDGSRYSSDIIIGPEKMETNWWRKSGHSLCIDDLEPISSWDIKILVVGTGASGMMTVPEEVRSGLKSRGVVVEAEQTDKAVERFNRYKREGRKVAGAFHLTC